MNNKNTAFALFDNQELIEEAVEKLHEGGYHMGYYTTVPDYYLLEEKVIGHHYLGGRMNNILT